MTSKEQMKIYLEERIETWDEEKVTAFQDAFLVWYDQEKRLLPWRENDDPYRIWVSEIMLQQTRVETVIPYFYRFMEWFPTIQALAEAKEERLLKAWEGLGYYSRVRNMQVAAQQIMSDYDGQMPQNLSEIETLKGIGPYTAGAIASMAFHLPEPAIDGNVMRVFSRLFQIEEDISKPATRKIFDYVVRHVISHKDPSSFNQAIMDLGSGVCTPTNPLCETCPLQSFCGAYREGKVDEYPVKLKKTKVTQVYYVAQVIQNAQGEFLLTQRASTGLLANLWHFPLEEVSKETFQILQKETELMNEQKKMQVNLEEEWPNSSELSKWLDTQTLSDAVVWQKKVIGETSHIFSHLKWHILVIYGKEREDVSCSLLEKQKWVNESNFDTLTFPKPQQKMLALLKEKNYL